MKVEITAKQVEAILKDFTSRSTANTLKNEANERAFDKPLVGYASGGDPIFEEYKEHVGPFYMTPWEIFALTYNDMQVKPDDLTVISYILPQTAATKKDNRQEDFYPISESGKDKQLCKAHLFPVTSSYVKHNFGFDGYGCGLCQTGVPCESKIPLSKEDQADQPGVTIQSR